MEQISFKSRKKLILTQIAMNKWMILFFVIAISLAAFLFMIFSVVKSNDYSKIPYIAPTSTTFYSGSGSTGSSSTTIYESLSELIFGSIGICVFLVINIVFCNKIIMKELNSGQISIWLTSGSTRTQIALSKIFTIYIINLLVYLPSILFALIISAFAQDSFNYFGLLFFWIIQVVLFTFFLASILILVSIFFNEKATLVSVLFCLVIVWIFATWFMSMFFEGVTDSKFAKILPYITLESLIFPVMKFGSDYGSIIFDTYDYGDGYVIVTQPEAQPIVWGLSATMPIILCGIICGLGYLSVFAFKNKDIKI